MSIESGWCGLLCAACSCGACEVLRPDPTTRQSKPTRPADTAPVRGRTSAGHRCRGESSTNVQDSPVLKRHQSDVEYLQNWRVRVVNGCKFNKVSYFSPVFSPYLTQMMQ